MPRDLLPEEYGGKVGKIADLKSEWIKRVRAHRDYFLDEQRWLVDESKRSASNNTNNKCSNSLNMEGSFRSLSID